MPLAGTNCWEYLQCPDKDKCPAFPKDGLGCWEVPGTLCRGQKQGTKEEKIGACRTICRFHGDLMRGRIQPHGDK